MSANELLIGYDVREHAQDLANSWGRERRRRFLFREDCPRPLSVDTVVWPSIFDTEGSLNRPGWTGPVQFLWDDLGRLRDYVSLRWKGAWKSCTVIAVTLATESCAETETESWKERVGRIEPDLVAVNSRKLGYDIADTYLQSGLSNCGFLSDEDALREKQRWSPELNDAHLFRGLTRAMEFRDLAALRSSEHAPFFVFGVRMINDVEALEDVSQSPRPNPRER